MKKKETLFKQGEKALMNISNIERGIYMCPICLSGFEIDSLYNGDLTLEHVPPKSVGGEGIILTCKKCNNEAGTKYESHLVKKNKVEEFANTLVDKKEGYGGRGKLKFDDIVVNVDLSTRDGKTNLSILDHNDPVKTAELTKKMKAMSSVKSLPQLSFQIETRESFSFRKIQISLLKSAYLVVTAKLGYKFACSPTLDLIREQLINPEKKLIENWHINAKKQIKANTLGFDFDKGVILVSIDQQSVLLPWPQKGIKSYVAIMELLANGITVDFSFKTETWPTSFEANLDNLSN